MKYIIALLAGLNLLAITAYYFGVMSGKKTNLWVDFAMMALLMFAVASVSWAAFSGRPTAPKPHDGSCTIKLKPGQTIKDITVTSIDALHGGYRK